MTSMLIPSIVVPPLSFALGFAWPWLWRWLWRGSYKTFSGVRAGLGGIARSVLPRSPPPIPSSYFHRVLPALDRERFRLPRTW